jgi:hypothetical protein
MPGHLQVYLGEIACATTAARRTVRCAPQHVIKSPVARPPLTMCSIVDETKRCHWFGSSRAAAVRAIGIGMPRVGYCVPYRNKATTRMMTCDPTNNATGNVNSFTALTGLLEATPDFRSDNSREGRELSVVLGQEVVDCDPVLRPVALHLVGDGRYRLIELGVWIGEAELLL